MLAARLRGFRRPATGVRLVYLPQDRRDVVGERPVRVIGLEIADLAYPPLMVPTPGVAFKAPIEPTARDLRRQLDGFEHRAVAVPSPPKIVDGARARFPVELFEGSHDVVRVYVVADLLALISEDRVMVARHSTPH